MKKAIIFSILVSVLSLFIYGQDTLTIYPDKDAILVYLENNPACANSNYGTDSRFRTWEWTNGGKPYKIKGMMGIDLSSLPASAYILEAKLYLYGTGDHNSDIINGSGYNSNASYLRRVTTSWSESTVTWNTSITTTTTNQVTIPNSTTADQDYVVYVTKLIKDIQINPASSDGLMLSLVSPVKYTDMCFASSDHATSTLHPKLEITYHEGYYSDSEGFELPETKWDDIVGDNLDWTLRIGGTPSYNTGPSGAYEGSTYAFVESSGNGTGYPSKTAYLESEDFYLPEVDNIQLSFNYHMYGAAMGDLVMLYSTNHGANWYGLWNTSGNHGDSWHRAVIDLSGYAGGSLRLRLKAITGSSYTSDIAVDNIQVTANKDPDLSSDQNYIYTRVAMSDQGNSGPIMDDVQYYDGLGRLRQQVSVGSSPMRDDLVKPVEYEYDRVEKNYLAFPADDENFGSFRDYEATGDDVLEMQEDFFQDHFDLGTNDPYAYAETIFEPSPLNRVLAQGAVGDNWQPTGTEGLSGNTQKYEYSTNAANDIRIWNISDTICSSDDTYDAGELYQTIVYNENYNTSTNPDAYSVEYKNKQGKVILKESYTTSETLRTYYIYDDFGLLRYVFPPEYSDSFSGSSGSLSYTPSTTGIKDYCYYYKYDDRHRMVEKQLPGAERVYMVYDYRDRLVGIQDGELRINNEWIYTKYDVLNRPVITFKLSYTFAVQPREYYQDRIDMYYDQEWVEYYEVPTSTGYGYSDQSYPLLSQAYPDTILTLTYYDNYDFLSLSGFTGLSFDNTHTIDGYYDDDGNNNGYFDKVRGQVTGTKSLVLDGTGTTWINASTYYDDRYRPIQVRSSMYPSGTTIVSNDYDFMGKVERSKETQTLGSNTTEMLTYYTYDHSGRLMETSVSVDQATQVVLAENTYNELGELVEKELHLDGQSAGLQRIDYGYNIRGWLTGINDVNDLSTDGDYFAMDLMYDEIDSNIGNTSQHNGNISAVKWAKTGSSDIQAYAFGYDPLNRILSSDYLKKIGSTWYDSTNYETSYAYDLNGNIDTLTRINGTATTIDNVVYTYDGNQLDEIDDGASSTLGVIDDDVAGQDYTYDMNGNMTRDLNKGLDVDYNYLNLPKKVYEIGGVDDEIFYIYDAFGVKWLKKIDNSSMTNIAYCGSFVYMDAGATGTYELDYVLNSEGKIEFDQSGHTFHYLVKDHLGNTRVEFDEDQNVNQLVDYYPFGMTFSTSQLGDNKYLYNGKELQDEQLGGVNLDWYDYGARFYDPALGRFHTQDRFAEKYLNFSPYQYAANNPIMFIDINGDSVKIGMHHHDDANSIIEGLQSFANSDAGKEFLLSFMSEGEEVDLLGLKATEDGKFRNKNLIFGTTGGESHAVAFHDFSKNKNSAIGKGDYLDDINDMLKLKENKRFDIGIMFNKNDKKDPDSWGGTIENLSLKNASELAKGLEYIISELDRGKKPDDMDMQNSWINIISPIQTK